MTRARPLSVATLNGTLSPHYLSPLSRRRRNTIGSWPAQMVCWVAR